jgi:hypothetical protein
VPRGGQTQAVCRFVRAGSTYLRGYVDALDRDVGGSRLGPDSEGECPKKDEFQESQGYHTWRNPAVVHPNRQRDQTPEARPLRQQCPCAESAGAPTSKRDRSSDLSDEQVFGTANLGQVQKLKS